MRSIWFHLYVKINFQNILVGMFKIYMLIIHLYHWNEGNFSSFFLYLNRYIERKYKSYDENNPNRE